MEHVLDNPAWNALLSGNKLFANGNEYAKYFDTDISPFAALPQYTAQNFDILHDILPDNAVKLFVSVNKIVIPRGWKELAYIKGLQMIYNGIQLHNYAPTEVVNLSHQHVSQMMELTRLTNPGPFEQRTIEFGYYQGIFDNEQLVAMAGQRLHIENFTEISAVCTHPDYTGRGYARQLLLLQIDRMQKAGNIPILHVRHDNAGAIHVYQSIGFEKRTTVHFYILQNVKD